MEPVFTESLGAGSSPLLAAGDMGVRGGFHGRDGAFPRFHVEPDRPRYLRHAGRSSARNRPRSLRMPHYRFSSRPFSSAIERAFQIGFLIFMPFLIIDLVVADEMLMSMGHDDCPATPIVALALSSSPSSSSPTAGASSRTATGGAS